MKYFILWAIALLIILPLLFVQGQELAWAENPTQVLELQTNRSCRFCNLTNAYLPVRNFDYTFLLGSDLSKANLMGSSITFSNLSRANLNGANLRFVNFKHTKMPLADFTNAIFDKTDLTDADLTSAVISETQLAKSKLCRTVLPNGLRSNRDC